MKQVDTRKSKILDILEKQKVVYVSELSEQLNVSEVTIRKYLSELEEEGSLSRTHGGAKLVRPDRVAVELTMSELSVLNVEEKKAIAKTAYEYIADGDAILLDASTTALELTHLIRNGTKKDLTIITTGLCVSLELAPCKNINVIQIGGMIRASLLTSMGPMAVSALQNLHADKAFIGLNGVDPRYGLTTQNIMESDIKRQMIKISSQAFVLADHSKLGNVTLGVICPVNEVDYIITDEQSPKEIILELEETGVDVIIAKDE